MKIKILTTIGILIIAGWFIACEGPSQPVYGDDGYIDPYPNTGITAVVDSIFPIIGKRRDTLWIYGENFRSDSGYNLVSFGNIMADTIINRTSTLLTVIVPKGKRRDTVAVSVAVVGSVYWSNSKPFIFK